MKHTNESREEKRPYYSQVRQRPAEQTWHGWVHGINALLFFLVALPGALFAARNVRWLDGRIRDLHQAFMRSWR